MPCAVELVNIARVKAEKRAAKAERMRDREKRESLKTRSDWIKDARDAVNRVVRLRDRLAGHPCISSGRLLDWSGNQVDAGHYRSVGSAPHLRFNLHNIHAQSKHDNQWLGGNAVDYRINLIKRIGIEKVEALEADQTPRHFTIEYLQRLIKVMRKWAKRLGKRIERKAA